MVFKILFSLRASKANKLINTN
ncbi:hypothetical protein Nmel_013402 [Mimus melanotis]